MSELDNLYIKRREEMSETNSSESDLNLLLCNDLEMDTGNLCDDPLYKAIDALYNRGWTDYHKKKQTRSERHKGMAKYS